MPYIKTEEVKQIRNDIKKALPDFKFSITRESYSSVNIVIVGGPIDLENQQINHYYYKETLKNTELLKVVETIMNCIHNVKPEKIIDSGGDYGNIPNFYIHISVGRYDKPYKKAA